MYSAWPVELFWRKRKKGQQRLGLNFSKTLHTRDAQNPLRCPRGWRVQDPREGGDKSFIARCTPPPGGDVVVRLQLIATNISHKHSRLLRTRGARRLWLRLRASSRIPRLFGFPSTTSTSSSRTRRRRLGRRLWPRARRPGRLLWRSESGVVVVVARRRRRLRLGPRRARRRRLGLACGSSGGARLLRGRFGPLGRRRRRRLLRSSGRLGWRRGGRRRGRRSRRRRCRRLARSLCRLGRRRLGALAFAFALAFTRGRSRRRLAAAGG